MAAIKHGTAGSSITTLDLGQNYADVEVVNRGAVDVWIMVDANGEAFEAEGDDVDVVPAKSSLVTRSSSQRTTSVSFLSSGEDSPVSIKGLP